MYVYSYNTKSQLSLTTMIVILVAQLTSI